MKTRLVFAWLISAMCVHAQAQVVNIPDANFKAALIDNGIDLNSNGQIETFEAEAALGMAVGSRNISDLTGIEAFTALEYLECGYNQITSLDLSHNMVLRQLYCSYNMLTALDLSHNTFLIFVECGVNKLTSIDVRQNKELQALHCEKNQLTSLDVTENTALFRLFCYDNKLANLDVSKTAMSELWCFKNQLTQLDVTKLQGLSSLLCDTNQLTNLDVSKNPILNYLDCKQNKLTSLLINTGEELSTLDCSGNKLSVLDIHDHSRLYRLTCNNNFLNALDVSNNAWLQELTCQNNPLSEICVSYEQLSTYAPTWIKDPADQWVVCGGYVPIPDSNFKAALIAQGMDTNHDGEISVPEAAAVDTLLIANKHIVDLAGIEAFKNLVYLDCSKNQIGSIDLSSNTTLVSLLCPQNHLWYLNVTANPALKYLSCYENNLYNLDVTRNRYLLNLYCGDNQLTSLYVTANDQLKRLSVYGNNLSALNLERNSYLRYFSAADNRLEFVSLAYNPQLEYFYAPNNLLTSLDLKDNRALVSVDVRRNHLIDICIQPSQVSKTSEWRKDSYAKWGCNNIQYVNIPDYNFKSALIQEGIDNNKNGLIEVSEALWITYLSVAKLYPGPDSYYYNHYNITDLTGIEEFKNLKTFNFSGNPVVKVNFTQNTMLEGIVGEQTSLKKLDVRKNTALRYVTVRNGGMDSLFTGPGLLSLDAMNNYLKYLNVKASTKLERLDVFINKLTAIDLSKNVALKDMNVSANQLTSLNLSKIAALERLNATLNDLPQICLNTTQLSDTALWAKDPETVWTVCGSSARRENALQRNEVGGLEIFPNPARTEISIRSTFDILSIRIKSANGKEVLQATGGNTLDVTSLPSGLYLAEIVTENGTQFRKLMIQ